MPTTTVLNDIDSYRQHFDTMFVGGIPRLLNDDGAFLSFVAVVTATDALAGLFAPSKGSGERFRLFVETFFPEDHRALAADIWQLRNSLIHSFNPGPFALTQHCSRQHLQAPLGIVTLNAEDFYAALLIAARAYFDALVREPALQAAFKLRVQATDGGAPETSVVVQHPRQ